MFLPTYARMQDGHLQRAVQSALDQTFEDFELLVVDDGSIDGTAQYLEEVALGDPRVRVTRLERNTGLPAYALAQAYPLATGRIFAWLFDDCVLEPTHLQRLVDTLDAHPEAAMAYGKVCARLADGDEFEIGSALDVAALEAGANMIPNVCVALRRDVVESIGWYDHHVLLKRLCDWDLWLRIARLHPVIFIDEILASEHGVGLPLSLGRLHQAIPALAVRYATLDRSEQLKPGDLRYEDAFEIPEGLDLNAAERADVDFVCFEHAMLTANHVLARRLALRLREGGAIETAFARYAARNERVAASGTTLLVATMELLRRRLARAAQDQIETEVRMRRALAVADERFAYIHAQEDEIRAKDMRLGELATQLQALGAQYNAQAAQMQEGRQASDMRILVLDDALQVSQRLQEATRLELANTTHTLLIYRDAADQRMSMLHAAHARIAGLESIAQQRLDEMEHILPVDGVEDALGAAGQTPADSGEPTDAGESADSNPPVGALDTSEPMESDKPIDAMDADEPMDSDTLVDVMDTNEQMDSDEPLDSVDEEEPIGADPRVDLMDANEFVEADGQDASLNAEAAVTADTRHETIDPQRGQESREPAKTIAPEHPDETHQRA